MTPRVVAVILIWGGVLALLGVLVFRFARGAWSLEDGDVPAITGPQKALAGLALAAAVAGVGLFVWSWNGVG
jgi:hypothetical protein